MTFLATAPAGASCWPAHSVLRVCQRIVYAVSRRPAPPDSISGLLNATGRGRGGVGRRVHTETRASCPRDRTNSHTRSSTKTVASIDERRVVLGATHDPRHHTSGPHPRLGVPEPEGARGRHGRRRAPHERRGIRQAETHRVERGESQLQRGEQVGACRGWNPRRRPRGCPAPSPPFPLPHASPKPSEPTDRPPTFPAPLRRRR